MGDYDSDPGGLPLPAILAIGALIFIYMFILQPILNWANENPLLFAAMAGLAFVAVLLLAMLLLMAKSSEPGGSGTAKILGGQVAPGSSGTAGYSAGSGRKGPTQSIFGKWHPGIIRSSVDFAPETPTRPGSLKIANEETGVNLLGAVAESVSNFRAPSESSDDPSYRAELADHLRKAFPGLSVGLYVAQNRPSVSVEKVAVELQRHGDKGPEKAFLDKCPAYAKDFPELVAVVLEPRFSREKYENGLSLLKKHFRAMAVVLKY